MPLTSPTFNFDGCSFSAPSIDSRQIPVLPHPIATNQPTDDVIRPTTTVAQLTALTDVNLATMDAPTAAAPTTVLAADLAAAAPTTSSANPVAMELAAIDTTTMDAPVAQIEVAQAEEDESVAIDEQRRPRTASIQPSTDPLPSVDIPLRKTGRVRQESTRMAQANMIGESVKRPRTGEVENAPKKKKCKSGA
ncbi:hypothetical protein P692DRAFT_20879929 [Suillus brevipes Sb2]|nr:hypothetical protein P692DRAFT_20879929 [Suillus brevipes Sb2]